LYNYLCAAAKSQPTSLFSAMHMEGQRARERAKRTDAPKKKANLGDLINLGNVELRRVKPTATEKRTKTGLEKVVTYALWERGLGGAGPRATSKKRAGKKSKGAVRPSLEFGKPLSSRGANYLAAD
jgi:hypothetical protein